MKRFLIFVCALMMVFGIGTMAKEAGAAYLNIDDSNPDEFIYVTVGQFESGFYLNGVLVQSGYDVYSSPGLSEEYPITFSGTWIDLGETAAFSRTIYWVEPNNPTLISDILSYSVSTDSFLGTITGTFQSDFNDNLGLLPSVLGPNDLVIVEVPGGVFDLSQPYLEAMVLTGTPEQVPEPTTMLLLGSGLIGLWGARKKFKK